MTTWKDIEREFEVEEKFEDSRDAFEQLDEDWSSERQYQGFLYGVGLDERFQGTVDELLWSQGEEYDNVEDARIEVADAYRDVRQAMRSGLKEPEDHVPGIVMRSDLDQSMVYDAFDILDVARRGGHTSGKKPQVQAATALYAAAINRYGEDSERFTQGGVAEAADVSTGALQMNLRDWKLGL